MSVLFDARFENYSGQKFKKDLISGITVGIIAIPLGMAFAIASGVKPEYGIYTTIIAGIIVALLGGSKFQIAGPTGAFIPLLFGIVSTYGYKGLLISGFLAGVILLVMGLLRLGVLIKYIPRPVIIGFTTGIAVIIFTGQISKFLGLTGVENKEFFTENIMQIVNAIHTINFLSIFIAILSFTGMMVTIKFFPKVPGALVGIVFSTIVATVFFPDKIATIGSVYGDIPSTLPSSVQLFTISMADIATFIRPAFTIAMLCAIESLLSAVVADGMTDTKHDSNRELIGQGVANMVTPLFGGIPATGAIARTATNIKTGAASPVSGIIQGLVVLLTLVVLAPYASLIPLASMAPILMHVAWNMSELKEFNHIFKARTEDSLVLIITFLLTVFVTLTVAVEVGLLLAMVLFVKRMSEVFKVDEVLPEEASTNGKVSVSGVTKSHYCSQIHIFDLEGSLFFGATETLANRVWETVQLNPKVIILRMNKLIYLDTSGEDILRELITKLHQKGCVVYISGIKEQPLDLMKKTHLFELVGEENYFASTEPAIYQATKLVNETICYSCNHIAFKECEQMLGQAAV